MEKINNFFKKSSTLNLLLFLCSFGIYFLYFHHAFLNINSILSSITSDSLKNYYTFLYHIKNDTTFLHFSGMNYPYGEHIIYTDCQPILTFILRLLPFTHDYLIGIMHSLMFLSFIVSPLIINKIFHILNIDRFTAFFVSLAICLLSPQFLKINGGHFALAYGCIIPLSILLVLNYLTKKNQRSMLILLFYNTILFLLHPYMGFCLSLFAFFGLLFYELFSFNKKNLLRMFLVSSAVGLLPILLFKVFMILTDHHTNRTTEPYGAEVMIENLDSILSPVFGPFQKLMEQAFSNRPTHYEGHTYIGFFTILLSLLLLVSLPFVLKKMKVRKDVLAILLASLLFLFIAFGFHLKILNYFHIQSASLNQFRAVCRFAWIFYFTLPLFLVTVFYHGLKGLLGIKTFQKTTVVFSLLFFCFNMVEANSFLTLDEVVYWKYRNFFNAKYLNQEEENVIGNIHASQVQAILPLPMFHGGSEMYERVGSNNSMIPSMIYSYHTKTPILSVLMSRTSLTETKDMIEIFNCYKKKREIEKSINEKDIFVLTTNDPLLPDETRLLKKVKQFGGNDSLKFGYISVNELAEKNTGTNQIVISSEKLYMPDSVHLVFIPFENRKPFLLSNILDYETIFVLDSGKVRSGAYIVSFHYYYTQNTYRAVAADLIITQTNKNSSEWLYMIPVRRLSGFYKDFSVFEYRIDLDNHSKYEFILKGFVDQNYKVSHFLLRPEEKNVLLLNNRRDTLFNNFPD